MSDWMTHDHKPPPRPNPQYPESTIWTLHKTGRTVEARLRDDGYGRQLCVYVNEQFLWSERERPGVDLYALAAEKLADFEARGWHA